MDERGFIVTPGQVLSVVVGTAGETNNVVDIQQVEVVEVEVSFGIPTIQAFPSLRLVVVEVETPLGLAHAQTEWTE